MRARALCSARGPRARVSRGRNRWPALAHARADRRNGRVPREKVTRSPRPAGPAKQGAPGVVVALRARRERDAATVFQGAPVARRQDLACLLGPPVLVLWSTVTRHRALLR